MDALSSQYASALYGLIEPKQGKDYCLALDSVVSSLDADPEWEKLLCSHAISKAEREQAIEKTFGKTVKLPYLVDFLKVVSAHHRFSHFREIVEAFESLVNEADGIKQGIVYSASKLSAAQVKSIEDGLSKRVGSQVKLRQIVDPSLLGGVKVALDGKVYDGSLKSKLSELQRQLLSGGKAS